MATRTVPIEREAPRAAVRTQATAGAAVTWALLALSSTLVGGLYLDGWAHNHRKLDVSLLGSSNLSQAFTPPGLPSTLTYWHAPYVAGVLATGIVLVVALWRNRAHGMRWRDALPAGYGLSLLGVAMIIAGAAGEVVWPVSYMDVLHRPMLGGQALTALLSPLRLLQAVGLVLVVTGPLRAAWAAGGERDAPGVLARLPVVLSATLFLSVLTYVTQFAHPFVDPWASAVYWFRSLHIYRYGHFLFGESLGVLSIWLQTALLMSPLLLLLRRWALPFGSLTLTLTLNASLMAVLQNYYPFVLVGAAAGLLGDLLLRRMGRPEVRPLEFRLFAFALPVVYYLLYFLLLPRLDAITASWGTTTPYAPPQEVGTTLGWNDQLWTGAALTAGLVGWLISLLVLPPRGAPVREP